MILEMSACEDALLIPHFRELALHLGVFFGH